MKTLVLGLCACLMVLALVDLSGCSATTTTGGSVAGSGILGGLAYWLLNLPVVAKACYYIGDEAALVVMPKTSATAQKDTVLACAGILAYLKNAAGLPALAVNTFLSAQIAALDPFVQTAIQAAATQLGQYIPPATAALSQTEVDDIAGFVQGVSDGTVACETANPTPAQVAKVTLKKCEAQARVTSKVRACAPSGAPGWFCAPAK
jgi:F0F1-type ATP synthase assembly protein I